MGVLLIACWTEFTIVFIIDFLFFCVRWVWFEWRFVLIRNIIKLFFRFCNFPIFFKNSLSNFLITSHKFFFLQITLKSKYFFKKLNSHLFIIIRIHIASSLNMSLKYKHSLFFLLISINTPNKLFFTSSNSHKGRKAQTINTFINNKYFGFFRWITWLFTKRMSKIQIIPLPIEQTLCLILLINQGGILRTYLSLNGEYINLIIPQVYLLVQSLKN